MSQEPDAGDSGRELPGQPRPDQEGTPPGQYGAYGQQPAPDQYGAYGQQPAPDPYGQYGQPPGPDQYGQYGQYGQQAASDQYGQYGQYGQQPAPDQYGQYAPQLAPHQYGQYGQAPGGAYYGPGYVPVPTAVQPGVIPLRPLTLGEIYDGAFRAVRSNPLVMFGLAIIVVGIGAVLQIAFTAAFFGRVERAVQAGVTEFDAVFSVGSFAGLLLSSAAVGLATLVLEGLAIISVSESVIGRKIGLAEVWQRARGRIWRLLLLSLLMGLAAVLAVVAAVVVIAVVSVAFVEASGENYAVLILLIPLLFVVFVGLIAFVGVRVMFATCVIMLEDTGVFGSIGRSWRLTKGSFWRLFGIMLLTSLLVGILVSILSVPFSLVGNVFAFQGDLLVPFIISSIGQLVGSAISIPVMAAVLALLYIDVRMRKEGLDVELARAAQAG